MFVLIINYRILNWPRDTPRLNYFLQQKRASVVVGRSLLYLFCNLHFWPSLIVCEKKRAENAQKSHDPPPDPGLLQVSESLFFCKRFLSGRGVKVIHCLEFKAMIFFRWILKNHNLKSLTICHIWGLEISQPKSLKRISSDEIY